MGDPGLPFGVQPTGEGSGGNLLIGRIEIRLFPKDWGGPMQEEPFPDPQVMVEGLAYPDLVRVFVETSGRFGDFHIVEEGPLRFFEDYAVEEERRERALLGQDADVDPVQPHLLHLCTCGSAECYSTNAEIGRRLLNGEEGLVIETSWCRWFRENPYPVLPVFVPLTS